MSRTITLIAIVQVLMVILGFATLGIVLKSRGYPDLDPLMVWTPLAVFLRERGFALLIVPAIWTLLFTVVQHQVVARRAMIFFGVLLAIGLFSIFLYATIFPGTRGFLHLPPS